MREQPIPTALEEALAAGWMLWQLPAALDYSEWCEDLACPFVAVQPLAGRAELYVNTDGRARRPPFDAPLAEVRAALLGDAGRWADAEFLLFDLPELTEEAAMAHAAALGRAITEGE